MPFDKAEALKYARHAEAASFPDADSKAWLEINGYREIQQFDIDHSQAYVCRDDDTALCVIRGSNDFIDWWRNVKGLVRTWADENRKWMGRVHRGFHQSYRAFGEQIEGALRMRRMDSGIKRGVNVGPSLGA